MGMKCNCGIEMETRALLVAHCDGNNRLDVINGISTSTSQPQHYPALQEIQIAAIKYDSAKPHLDLMSSVALEGLGRVLTYGEKKYAAHNWRKGMTWSRLIAATMRHLLAFNNGEDIDPESGLPHVDHAACCLHFLSEYQKLSIGTDDRYKRDK